MSYRALYNVPHRRYLTKFWNFGYDLRVKRKENYLNIRKCNNIKNNSKKQNSGKKPACSKLQVPKTQYGHQI